VELTYVRTWELKRSGGFAQRGLISNKLCTTHAFLSARIELAFWYIGHSDGQSEILDAK